MLKTLKRLMILALGALILAVLFDKFNFVQGKNDIYPANPSPTIEPLPDPRKNSIESFLTQQTSPLSGEASVFVEVADRFNLDPYLLVGIAGAESGFGKHNCARFNPFGLGGNPCFAFESYEEALLTLAANLNSHPAYRLFREDQGNIAALARPYTGGSGETWIRIVNWTQTKLKSI